MKKFIIFLVVILILPVAVNMIVNEVALFGFSKQLNEAELPPAATKISQYNSVGLLTEQGGCGFVARIEVDFRLGEEVLKEHFKDISFQSAYGNKVIRAEIIPKNMIEEIDGMSVYKRRTDGALVGGQDIYYIQLYDDGYPKFLDLRCYKTFQFTKGFIGRQF